MWTYSMLKVFLPFSYSILYIALPTPTIIIPIIITKINNMGFYGRREELKRMSISMNAASPPSSSPAGDGAERRS